ncbi:uncharacterized protein [Dermacentor andersoni]|uniref:uncharacterized protein isoform X1 n=1 Tax=Dermacentor andersoni TaxID=34620 RepID=UPI003B3B4FA7
MGQMELYVVPAARCASGVNDAIFGGRRIPFAVDAGFLSVNVPLTLFVPSRACSTESTGCVGGKTKKPRPRSVMSDSCSVTDEEQRAREDHLCKQKQEWAQKHRRPIAVYHSDHKAMVTMVTKHKTDLCSRRSLAASAMLAQGENALGTLPSASTVILAQLPWWKRKVSATFSHLHCPYWSTPPHISCILLTRRHHLCWQQ